MLFDDLDECEAHDTEAPGAFGGLLARGHSFNGFSSRQGLEIVDLEPLGTAKWAQDTWRLAIDLFMGALAVAPCGGKGF